MKEAARCRQLSIAPYSGCSISWVSPFWEKMELLHVLEILAALYLECPYY